MRIPSFKRIFKTDFAEEDQNLIERLSSPINDAIGNIQNALNKNISISDNVLCTVKDVLVTVDSSGTPKSSTSFSIDISGTVKGLLVLRAENQENSGIYPTTAPFISFTQSGSNIVFNNVSGLQANNQYLLRVLALG